MVTERPHSVEHRIRAIVPAVAGWRTYRGALVNLLVFALAAVGGEWLVHQVEYLIEYGPRFGTVMATTPHRYYMAPLGVLLFTATLVLLAAAICVLAGMRRHQRRLLEALPPRLAALAAHPRGFQPAGQAMRTAAALAALQTVLYVLQENVESAVASQGWPGLAVLLAPQHLTVLPLHCLIATAGAILLCTLAGLLRRLRQAVQVAQTLVRFFAHQERPAPRLRPRRTYLPNLRLAAGLLCLRSPPLTA